MARSRPDTVRRPRGETRRSKRSGTATPRPSGPAPRNAGTTRPSPCHGSWPISLRRCRPTPSWWTRQSRRAPTSPVRSPSATREPISARWTAAHHDLPIVFVILNNGEYRILKHNMDVYRQRFGAKPDRAYLHMDLGKPRLGFLDLARGLR